VSIATQYYLITLAMYFFIYVILELGYNMQFGLTGIINIAVYVCVAFGGYVGATVTMGPNNFGQSYILGMNLPFPLPVIAGGIAGALVSATVGVIVIRLRDQYQAIVTLVIAQMAYLFVGNYQPLFNGFLGLANVPHPLDTTLNLSILRYQYVFLGITAAFAVLAFLFMQRVSHSPLGRVLRSIREDQEVAAVFGKNVIRLQMLSFVVGGFLAGVGGAFIAEYLGTISPSIWSTSEAFIVIAALLVGGTGNNYGAVLGALVLPVGIYELTQLIPSFGSATDLIDAARWILIGLLVCAFLWFRPEGLLAERKTKYRALRNVAKNPAPLPEETEPMQPEKMLS
jgi:branched-chain amino acid transport system permease protein